MSIFSLRTALSAAIVMGAAALMPQVAAASCIAPAMESGRYVNTDANTRSITTVDLQFVCGTLYRDNGDGTGTIIHGGDPHWTMRLWGSCHPSDCDWGEARGERSGSSDIIQGAYDQGFAQRNVSVYPDGANIRLVITSSYNDGRPSRTWVETMRRQ